MIRLFEIMCAGGCGRDFQEIEKFFYILYKITMFALPLILAIIGMILLIIGLAKKKKTIKKGLIMIAIAVITFIVLTVGDTIIGTHISESQDSGLYCWCN